MLKTKAITQIATTRSDLYAFRIHGEVTADGMEEMSQYMNDAFDRHDEKVDMLLIFDRYDGAQTGATWSWEAIKSRVRSAANVNRYVVVGAPDSAQQMIEAMGNLVPVKAEVFDTEAPAWRHLNAEAKAA